MIFEIMTYPLSVINNPLLDFIFMSIIGAASFVIAWNFVGDIDVRGKLGSIIHWIVRLFSIIILCSVVSLIVKIYQFVFLT